MKKLNVCVLGATGLVGQQFIRLLEDHPYFDLKLITASRKSEGKSYYDTCNWLLNTKKPKYVENMALVNNSLTNMRKNDINVVFSALPSQEATKIEKKLVKNDLYIFTNASSHRMDTSVPILVPEINPDHIDLVNHQKNGSSGFIISNSNCSTAGAIFGIKPLENFGIKSVFFTTYQALSGAGKNGLDRLKKTPKVVPFIPYEETKIERESKKILGEYNKHSHFINEAPFYINASCARVPVRNGHLISTAIELNEKICVETAIETLCNFKGKEIIDRLPTAPKFPISCQCEVDQPQNEHSPYYNEGERKYGMDVSIGRIRKKGKYLNFFILVHNTIRGAAGASILNAEFAYSKNYLI